MLISFKTWKMPKGDWHSGMVCQPQNRKIAALNPSGVLGWVLLLTSTDKDPVDVWVEHEIVKELTLGD